MKKKVLVVFVLILLFLPVILADSVDDEIQKLTHYAEEYETGNIDYVKLMVYVGAVREKLNEELGVFSRKEGGLLKQEQIKNALGKPTEETKWVWVEKQERDRKLLKPVPVWRKLVFDGNKIQIKIEAFPSIFVKGRDFGYAQDKGGFEEEIIVYRLHFDVLFKKPEDRIDIKSKIDKVKSLAEIYNSDSSSSNAENLAKESVNVERAFEDNYRESGGECVDLMNSIFGSEFKKETQKLLVQEINFYDGDNFEAIIRLEMCDDCDYNWINLDLRIEGRGPGFKHPENKRNLNKQESMKKFKEMDNAGFKAKTKELISEIKRVLETGDISSAMSYKNKLWMLNEAWNQNSNDLWDKVKQEVNFNPEENNDPYFWIKEDQKQRKKVKELRKKRFEERKRFYTELFSGYNRNEYYFEQEEWEKRLVEVFKERGKEICNNNQDDNENEQIDCKDEQCGGRICGKDKVERVIEKLNENSEVVKESIFEEVDLYCIAGACQQKEEIVRPKGPVCGNNKCEKGENNPAAHFAVEGEDIESEVEGVYCPEDCRECPVYDAIECKDGKLMFSGTDKNGCQLPPVCVKEKTCFSDDDCQFRCGIGKCVFEKGSETGNCKVVELTECKKDECVDGEKKIKNCNSGGELIVSFCKDSLWKKTELDCEGEKEKICCAYSGPVDELLYEWRDTKDCQSPEGAEFPEQIVDNSFCKEKKPEYECIGNSLYFKDELIKECSKEKVCNSEKRDCLILERNPVIKDECVVKSDCGNLNDVCSNGKCVTIPEVIKEEEEEIDLSNLKVEKKEIVKEIRKDLKDEIENKESQEQETKPVEEDVSGPGLDVKENPSEKSNEVEVTGNIIVRLFKGFGSFLGLQPRIIGAVVNENNSALEPTPEPQPSPEPVECPDIPEPEYDRERCSIEKIYDEKGCLSGYEAPVCDDESDTGPRPEPDNDCRDKWKACGDPCPPCDYEKGYREEGRDDEDHREWEERDNKEREMHEKEQRERCKNECMRMSGVEECIRKACGENLDCDIDEERKKCESQISIDKGCVDKCMKGGEWYKEFQKEDEHKEEKGVFTVLGNCRKAQGKTESHINFGGWGEPFEGLERYKQKYYEREGDWCKWDLENSIKQRKEIEKGFNQDFAKWFFEDYLANSAEDWEQSISGLFDMYWRNVDISRMMAERMQCLGKNDITEIFQPQLINFEYKTEYGSIEYWEELKEVKMPWSDEKVTIVSPYMKVWIYPTKRFIKYEFKSSMEKGELPGTPEDKIKMKNEGFPSQEDLDIMRNDDRFMKIIKKISDKYEGDARAVVQVVDFENNEIVFNILVEINKKDIIKITPMLPSEVRDYDTKVEIDFDKMYDMIMFEEKNMMGAHIESPPWDRKRQPVQKIKDFANGIRMYFKAKAIVNSAKVTPKSDEKNVKKFMISMMKLMNKKEGQEGPPEGFEDLTADEKKELIKDFKGNIFNRGKKGNEGLF